MLTRLRFEQAKSPVKPYSAYLADVGRWRFLIIDDRGQFTVSYRLRNPKGSVSASSTIMGPFTSLGEAEDAANAKWAEIKRLS